MPDQAAYHVQQAAEKLTKAALVAHQIRPRKGHVIESLRGALAGTFVHRDRFLALDRFSDYVWAHRYPEEDLGAATAACPRSPRASRPGSTRSRR